jgi:hypothetical protein
VALGAQGAARVVACVQALPELSAAELAAALVPR